MLSSWPSRNTPKMSRSVSEFWSFSLWLSLSRSLYATPSSELLIIKNAADNKEDGCLTYRVNQKLNDKNTFIMFEEVSATYSTHSDSLVLIKSFSGIVQGRSSYRSAQGCTRVPGLSYKGQGLACGAFRHRPPPAVEVVIDKISA